MNKRTTLLLLSGGLDSTTCLFNLLENTEDDVHTFYVELDNNDKKVWCENESISRIRDIKTRDFTHHTGSKFDIRGSANGIQPFLWMTAGATMLNKIDGPRKRLCIGYTHGDEAAREIDIIQYRWNEVWKILGAERKKPPLYLPLLKRTKMQSMDYLRRLEQKNGVKIIESLWTCEDPQRVHGPDFSGYTACKKCLPCTRGLEIGFVKP